MDKETRQIYRQMTRPLQVELADRHPELRPILDELIRDEATRPYLADWGRTRPDPGGLRDLKEKVKSDLDIRTVVEFYGFPLDRSGRCPCMFHGGKKPNFSTYDRTKFQCFVCGERGDIFGFAMKLFNLTFPEAIRRLAGDFGVTQPTRVKRTRPVRARPKRVDPMDREACRLTEWYRVLSRVIREHHPGDLEAEPSELYGFALGQIGTVEFFLDELAEGRWPG